MYESQSSKQKISFVLPVFNEEKNISLLIPEIKSHINPIYDYEFILVDDGSSDSSWEEIQKLSLQEKNIKGISFYRNFGHQNALRAGLMHCTGNVIITLDADFQHPPKLIPQMLELWQAGHDLVVAKKSHDTSSPLLLKIIRNFGYKLYQILGDGKVIPGVSDFRLMDRAILDYLLKCEEFNFIIRGLVMIPAKKPFFIDYEVEKRKFGKSGYSFRKLFNLFTQNITSFSTMPLRLGTFLSFIMVVLSLLYLIFILFAKFVLNLYVLPGWTALMSVVLLLFGSMMLYLGIISEYLITIFNETKKRPSYVIWKKENL